MGSAVNRTRAPLPARPTRPDTAIGSEVQSYVWVARYSGPIHAPVKPPRERRPWPSALARSAALLDEVERHAERRAVRARGVELGSARHRDDAARDARGEARVARHARGVDLAARSDLDHDDELARLRGVGL